MRLQRMLGHMTTLIPENPRSVLVIGCGAGVTAGAVSNRPRLTAVTIAEIEPLVPATVSKYFSSTTLPWCRTRRCESISTTRATSC